MRDGAGTRRRIQETALGLFAERGYDATSLQEIADRLGVTKAALYYHFPTKAAILDAALDDYLRAVDDLLGPAEAGPRDAAARAELLTGYAAIVADSAQVLQYFQHAPAGRDDDANAAFRARMGRLNRLLHDDDAPLADHVRALAAVVTLHVGLLANRPGAAMRFVVPDPVDDADLHDAVLGVARQLAAANASPTTDADAGPDAGRGPVSSAG